MKITQSQYFEIEEFFTEKCRLTETEFVEELIDHFSDGIEYKMTDGILFNNALNETVEEFGGVKAIRKMQWSFQYSVIKRQVRAWFKCYDRCLEKPQLYKVLAIAAAMIAFTFYICLFTAGDSTDHKTFVGGFMSGMFLVPIGVSVLFLIQFHFGWLRSFGSIIAQNIASAGIPFVLNFVSLLLFLGITEYVSGSIIKALLLSVLWSALAISYFVTFEYSKKTNATSRFEMR